MAPDVVAVLRRATAIMAGARDPWCVIGIAALSLRGLATDVADIDVLISERDAEALGGRWPETDDGSQDQFRPCFVRIGGPGLPVEVMGALEVSMAGG